MSTYPERILCVGHDTTLLRTRAAVLQFAGYETDAVLVDHIREQLRSAHYALVVLSVRITPSERDAIEALVEPGTEIISLDGLTLPDELIMLVKIWLQEVTPSA